MTRRARAPHPRFTARIAVRTAVDDTPLVVHCHGPEHFRKKILSGQERRPAQRTVNERTAGRSGHWFFSVFIKSDKKAQRKKYQQNGRGHENIVGHYKSIHQRTPCW